MSNAVKKLLPSLMALSTKDKETIAQQLIDSLEQDNEDAEFVAELNRRVKECRSGKVRSIPSEEVHRILREKYG
jgi:putative addiction module component (TIGR02574 family)